MTRDDNEFLEDLPPRYFCDFKVPGLAEETVTEVEYSEYVRWLADYLHRVELPLSEAQQEWLRQTDHSPRGVIFSCSDSYGFAASPLEDVSRFFADGEDYDAWRSRMRLEWESFYPTPEDREENPIEEYNCLPEGLFNRLHREWRQEREMGQEWSHADIPFRSLLSWALHQIPDSEERFKEMDFYFKNFHETSCK